MENRFHGGVQPHRHLGQLEVCYDRLCTRITTDQATIGFLGALALAGILAVAAR